MYSLVSLKNGTSVEKVEVGVFDETAEGFLILWGALATCATNWQPSKTSRFRPLSTFHVSSNDDFIQSYY